MRYFYIALALTIGLVGCTDSNPDYQNAPSDGGMTDTGVNTTDGQVGPSPDGTPPVRDGQVIMRRDAQTMLTDARVPPNDSRVNGDGAAPSDLGTNADGGPPVDGDNDGVTSDLDCNDGDPTIFPGAPELCDGKDNNCDRNVDELWPAIGQPCTNGLGACQADGVLACSPEQDDVVCAAAVGEPRDEACDQVDNDCDGTIDESVAGCCIPGENRACGSAVGVCQLGVQTCDGTGRYGPCQGAIRASDEVCNGFDDDCDGTPDEDISRVCGSNAGLCETGVQVCADGNFGACIGNVDAAVEVCDTVDNDCDGQTDEGLTNACGQCGALPEEICDGADNNCDGIVDEGCECAPGQSEACGRDVGTCQTGMRRCMGGVWGECIGAVGPRDEECDNLDNDCDGNTDELIAQACGSDVGACAQGTKVCRAGSFGECVGGVRPRDEACDNVDNDCDGTTDENVSRSCGTDTGQCIAGTQRCDAGRFDICVGATGPIPEACDALDNDCDGRTDEALTQVCGIDVGQCSTGLAVCENGNFGECAGGQRPVAEVCDELDNDCDGESDEDLDAACGCDEPQDERCNGVDDDCDGQVDEVDSLCIIYAGAVNGPVENLRVGEELMIVGDLNGDGVEEAVASGFNQGQGVVVAVDGFAQENRWHHVDAGPLGKSLAVINADDPDDVAIFAGAPRGNRGAIHQFNGEGDEVEVFEGNDEFKLGEALSSHPDLPGLVIGYSAYNESRGSFLISVGDDNPFVSGLAPGQKLGEKVFLIPDLDGDLFPEIVSTVRFGDGLFAGRGTNYFPSTNWFDRSGTLSPLVRQTSFAESLVWGNFITPDSYFYLFGTPGLDRIGRGDTGGAYPVSLEGGFLGGALLGDVAQGGLGRRMVTYRRPGSNLDWALLGGTGARRVEFWRLRDTIGGPTIAERIPVTVDDVDASFGRSVAITQPTADGRSLLYVGEPRDGRGRIHLFWVR